MDWNNTGKISYDEFSEWFISKISRKYSKETLNTYYNLYKQPLNIINFSTRMNQEIIPES